MTDKESHPPPEEWTIPLAGVEDEEFVRQVEEAFKDIYQRYFRDEPLLVNHQLPILVRALRQHPSGWRIFLILTPWMLARIFSPVQPPGLLLPPRWSAPERANAPYVVIGPLVSLPLWDTIQKAHLNYSLPIGHYLLQPLVQSMDRFPTPQAVFDAWNQVIRTRDENIRKRNAHSLWQEEVSRREIITHWIRS
jgi:hypothetical protein